MGEHMRYSADGGPLSADQIEANFEDLHPPLDQHQARVEADRCLYCYDAPCIKACPTAIDIPTFIHQIRTGNVAGSAKTILGANIMGGTCARVCPTEELCEQACVRNTAEDKPVEIGSLQRYAVDHLLAAGGAHPFKRAAATGKRIAVVGAGPAGLACAHRLAMLGHDVVVYEAQPKPAGLNEYGLAAYKMADDFAQREVAFLLDIGGIEIVHGARLGDTLSLEGLTAQHDAVFLGVGLASTNRPALEGETLAGVEDAVDFIARLRQTDAKAAVDVGDEVVVIGGGNTAIDAAVQARRLGAEQVTLVYRRGAAQMPATDWEQDLAQKNGVTVRHWAAPVRFVGGDTVTAVEFERMRLEDGKLVGAGRHFTLPADQVLLAIGQTLAAAEVGGVALEHGKITLGTDYQTSRAGVFAGGDCTATGADLTVQAVEDGKRAAHAIDAYLS